MIASCFFCTVLSLFSAGGWQVLWFSTLIASRATEMIASKLHVITLLRSLRCVYWSWPNRVQSAKTHNDRSAKTHTNLGRWSFLRPPRSKKRPPFDCDKVKVVATDTTRERDALQEHGTKSESQKKKFLLKIRAYQKNFCAYQKNFCFVPTKKIWAPPFFAKMC